NINAPKAKTKVKVRNLNQLQEVLKFQVDEIYVTDKELMKYQNDYKNIKFYYVALRVDVNDNKYNIPIVESKLDYYNQANTSIYMNITNAYSVNLLEILGANSIGLSLELSMDQIESLIYNYKKLFKRLP